MEQRRVPRFAVNQSVAVTVLGANARMETTRVAATVKDASTRGLAMELPCPVPPGTAVRIDLEDSFVLGEAVYCRSTPEFHLVGVELDQMLCSLTELGRRLQEFAAPASGPQMKHALKNRKRQHHQETEEQ